MTIFEDIQDVNDWLDPLDYALFWEATEPWGIFGDEDRAHCDRTIANGIAPEETVLYCLKAMARVALTERFDLGSRFYEPVDAQYVRMTH